MNKKTQKRVAAERVLPGQIKESAQQLWSVGVDAINRAQAHGNRVFEALVREGDSIRKTIKEKAIGTADVGEVSVRASETWDKLEQVFERRVARALSSLGVPTRGELANLDRRLEALKSAVDKLSGAKAPSRPAKATSSVKDTPMATRKAATKPAPRSAAKPRRSPASKNTG